MSNSEVIFGACPLDCPDGCAWTVKVENGIAVKLDGQANHPITRGVLCAKVNGYLDHVAASDRVLYPLRRIGKKGSGKFKRITWDEALGEIANRFNQILEDYGGEAIWPYQGTGSLGYLQGLQGRAGSRFWNSINASQHDLTICSIAGLVGHQYVTGTSRGIDPEALSEAKLIILWGTNTLTSGHHPWAHIKEAKAKGAFVVVIDPVSTRTAKMADEHIAPIPGTDAALALGILNVVVRMGAEDVLFLAKSTVGWESYKARILEYHPKKVSELTGVDEDKIIELGERVALTRPTAIKAGQGVQRHAGGGMTLRVLATIGGVTGDWARPGGGLMYSTDGYFGGNRDALYRDDLLRKPVRKLSMTRLGEGLLELNDPPVMGLFIYGANPLVSSPHQNKIREGLLRSDLFTVVYDHFLTDTADYADIVLPSTMQTEHTDLHDGYGHLYIAWNEQAVKPRGEARSTTDVFRSLSMKMGLVEPSLYESDIELASQLLTSNHSSLNGITLDRLRREGWVRLNYPEVHVPFENGFPTRSGKLEFYSETALQDGQDPLPGFVPAKEVVDKELERRFPFVLVSGASHYQTNSTFANHEKLGKKAGSPNVKICPEDAGIRNINNGDNIKVFNSRGSFIAKAEISCDVQPGVLSTTKGHWLKLSEGATLNSTVDERDADLGGGSVFSDNRVDVSVLGFGVLSQFICL